MNNGCTEYDWMVARIPFPAEHVRCDLCPCLETYARKQCRLTGEYLLDTRIRGWWCPLEDLEDEQ